MGELVDHDLLELLLIHLPTKQDEQGGVEGEQLTSSAVVSGVERQANQCVCVCVSNVSAAPLGVVERQANQANKIAFLTFSHAASRGQREKRGIEYAARDLVFVCAGSILVDNTLQVCLAVQA